MLERLVGLAGLLILAPLSPLLLLPPRPRLRLRRAIGHHGRALRLRRFEFADRFCGRLARRLGLGLLPACADLLLGRMALVGPRPQPWGRREAQVSWRTAVRPGLVSSHWLRERAQIDYAPELESDREDLARRGLLHDSGLLLRGLAALAHGATPAPTPGRLELLGLRLDNLTLQESLDQILTWLDAERPRRVAFVNADCVNRASADARYTAALREADLCLADGVGVRVAGRLLGQPLRQNVNGTDLFPRLAAALAASQHSLFLLGARAGVAEALRAELRVRHPGLQIAGVAHGYFTPEQEPAVVAAIRESGASLLLVAFGAPRQELWLQQHLADTGARVGIGVGGLFDFYSGRIPRAPQWLRELGLEWSYRLWQEPRRMWRRYLIGNLSFLARVLRGLPAARRAARARLEVAA